MTHPAAAPEDLTALADAVQRFAQRAVAPHAAAWDEAGAFPRALYAEAHRSGCWAWATPRRWAAHPPAGACAAP